MSAGPWSRPRGQARRRAGRPAGVRRPGAPWTELPVWLPPDTGLIGLHTGDVSAAYAAGLSCRPVAETIRDTWAWLLEEGEPPVPDGRPAPGLHPDRERAVLASLQG
jgi:hypothetical protein